MTILQMGTLAVAALVALWPAVAWIPKIVPIVPHPAPPDGISYQTAMEALATVRLRLLQSNSEGIDATTKAAVEAITHALVEGSDQ